MDRMTMPSGLEAAEIAEAAATVRRLLGAVADGTLTADSGLVARLEGAVEALDQLVRLSGSADN
jgi:hypothetical protein